MIGRILEIQFQGNLRISDWKMGNIDIGESTFQWENLFDFFKSFASNLILWINKYLFKHPHFCTFAIETLCDLQIINPRKLWNIQKI